MSIYVDVPVWPAHGRQFAHLISDVSVAELHVFAEALGMPRRAFERDHYDVPDSVYPAAVALGARRVRARDIVRLLTVTGLRRPRHRFTHREN